MSADTPRFPITGTAQVVDLSVRLFPSINEHIPPDDVREWPWAVGAICRVRFAIGELTTTKRMTQKYAWVDHLGWPQMHRPTDDEIEAGIDTALNNLRQQIIRLGFDPGPLTAELTAEVTP